MPEALPPSRPTGRATRCLLFSDEVYREGLVCVCGPVASGVRSQRKGAVSLRVMSKTYGLPGLRIGWVATQCSAPAADGRAEGLPGHLQCSPQRILAAVALRIAGRSLTETVALLRQNLDVLDVFMREHASTFAWQPPIAGPIAFPGLTGHTASVGAEAFCECGWCEDRRLIAARHGLRPMPNHVRIGFGRRDLPEALAKAARALLTSCRVALY